MALIGSSEWFNEKSKTIGLNKDIENLRAKFIECFSAENLSDMTGSELLNKVFGDEQSSMMHVLMVDDDYRWFGSAGNYKYLGIVYQVRDGSWMYKEKLKPQTIDIREAEVKAEQVRDQLISCINAIKNIGVFETIKDYQNLQDSIKNVFFYKYPWAIKYYQMLYPQYFPGMYSDKTIERALNILGLPRHGKNRLLNAGEISLFTRRCDVNNILFNEIYAKQWGWDGDVPQCASASINKQNSSKAVSRVNTSFYKLSDEDVAKKRESKAIEIQEKIESLQLEGKEKEAIVKVRVNQGAFRKDLLNKSNKCCCLCGVKNVSLLVASHIKPWSDCEPNERLDVDNGFLLCPNHDKLFDAGLITFDDYGVIHISDSLDGEDRKLLNVSENMSVNVDSEQKKKYLAYHRDKVFKK